MKITKSFSENFSDSEVEKQSGERMHFSLEELTELACEKNSPFRRKCEGIIMSEDGITLLIKKIEYNG